MIESLLVPVRVALWAGAVLAVTFVLSAIVSSIAATVRLAQAARRASDWDLSAAELVRRP